VRIDGRFKGQIVASDTLIIGDEGIVEGEITVGELICSGTVRGTIRTSKSSEFLAPGKIEAELFTAQLRVERGVIFDGQIHMKTRE
jgi:cytoskeletal protein CcmA (bactofilin family)